MCLCTHHSHNTGFSPFYHQKLSLLLLQRGIFYFSLIIHSKNNSNFRKRQSTALEDESPFEKNDRLEVSFNVRKRRALQSERCKIKTVRGAAERNFLKIEERCFGYFETLVKVSKKRILQKTKTIQSISTFTAVS